MSHIFRATVETKELRAAMRQVEAAAETRAGGIPILAHAWLRFENGHLLITGTDLDQSVTVDVIAEGDGEITASAPMLLHAASVASGENVELEVLAQDAVAMGTKPLTFKSGKMQHTIPTLSVDQYPVLIAEKISSAHSWNIPGAALARALSVATLAAEKGQIAKAYQHGAWFQHGGKRPAIIACDGNILAFIGCPSMKAKVSGEFLVPTEAFKPILAICGEDDVCVSLTEARNAASFSCGNVTVRTKLVEAQIFDYGKIVPTSFSNSFRIDARVALESMARGFVQKMYDSGIKASVSDEAIEFSSHGDGITAFDSCEVSDVEGGKMEFGMLEKYLRWAVSTLDSETLEIKSNGSASPFVFIGKDGTADIRVVMPRRI